MEILLFYKLLEKIRIKWSEKCFHGSFQKNSEWNMQNTRWNILISTRLIMLKLLKITAITTDNA